MNIENICLEARTLFLEPCRSRDLIPRNIRECREWQSGYHSQSLGIAEALRCTTALRCTSMPQLGMKFVAVRGRSWQRRCAILYGICRRIWTASCEGADLSLIGYVSSASWDAAMAAAMSIHLFTVAAYKRGSRGHVLMASPAKRR